MSDPDPLPAEAAAYVTEWLGEQWTARALPGDASVRRYFRITGPDGKSYILAYYPEEVRSQLARFMDAYSAVVEHGRVPRVLQSCGLAVLQHDVGEQTLFDVLHEDRERGVQLYRKAVELLTGFQKAGAHEINPAFTAEFFLDELEMTCEYYVRRLMATPDLECNSLTPFLRMLAETIAQHPYLLCHRDFHGQNIHVVGDELFLIDYQDLRMGPDTYDLASLLRDRGVARILGDDVELALVDEYARLANAEGNVRERYFQTLLQRSLKILGTFSRQPIERGKLHYLDFIPPTLESVRRCLAELPQFAPLGGVLPTHFSIDAARERAAALYHQ